MKKGPVTKQSLIEFREKYSLSPTHLQRIFGLSHPSKWIEIVRTDPEKGESKDDLVDPTLALIYSVFANDRKKIEGIKLENLKIEDIYEKFSNYLGLGGEDKLNTDTFSIIIGKKPGFYDRVVHRQDNQTATTKTLSKILVDAIDENDHATVFKLIETAKREAKVRGLELDKVTLKLIALKKREITAGQAK